MLPEGAKPILVAGERPGAGPDPEPRAPRRWGRLLGAVFVFAVIVGFGSLIAYYFVQNRDGALDPASIPVVRADPRPMKLRPDSPGGIEVPFQNTEVYNRVGQQSAGADAANPGAANSRTGAAPNAANRPVERLLPGPEAPLPRPQPPPAPVAAIPVTPDVEPPPDAVVVAPPAPGRTPAAPSAPARNAPIPLTPQAVAPAPPPAAAPAPPPAAPPVQAAPVQAPPAVVAARPAPAAPAPAAAPPTGGVRIQLASVRAEAEAQREWGRLARQHADVLGGLTPYYVSADLGDRGVFVRLQAGPFAIPEAARAACETLRARGAGCNVVR